VSSDAAVDKALEECKHLRNQQRKANQKLIDMVAARRLEAIELKRLQAGNVDPSQLIILSLSVWKELHSSLRRLVLVHCKWEPLFPVESVKDLLASTSFREDLVAQIGEKMRIAVLHVVEVTEETVAFDAEQLDLDSLKSMNDRIVKIRVFDSKSVEANRALDNPSKFYVRIKDPSVLRTSDASFPKFMDGSDNIAIAEKWSQEIGLPADLSEMLMKHIHDASFETLQMVRYYPVKKLLVLLPTQPDSISSYLSRSLRKVPSDLPKCGSTLEGSNISLLIS